MIKFERKDDKFETELSSKISKMWLKDIKIKFISTGYTNFKLLKMIIYASWKL